MGSAVPTSPAPMRWIASSAAFGLALWIVLLVASAIDVYLLDHFDGAIGTRLDNFLLDAAICTGLALLSASGFAAALAWRRPNIASFPQARVWLPVTALIAGALIYSLTFLGPDLWTKVDAWWMSLGLISAYCIGVGALAGGLLALILEKILR